MSDRSRRLILRLAPAVVLGVLSVAPLRAQTASSSPDRWQVTLNDRSYLWNVRLVRLSQNTLTVRSADSLITTPIQNISSIQLLAETILRVGDGHRSGVGALGDNNSPVVDFAPLALPARRHRIQALLDYEAAHGPGSTGSSTDTPPKRVAVVSVALNDLSNQPVSPELPSRMQLLTTALRDRLTAACGYQVVALESGADTTTRSDPGYLYAHPAIAAELAGAQADWVIIPRLNRASPWVTDLQAQVVRARDTALVSNRIVEVKGIELSQELALKLVDRGAAWMADQLSQAIEYAASGGAAVPRRCPA